MEDAKANEWIARYSGDPLTKVEYTQRCQSQYIMQVHKNLFLDAADPIHFEGRFINDARNSKYKVYARFAVGYTTNTCSTTDHIWVRIYVTKKIKAGDEICIDYGADFWSHQPLLRSAMTPTKSKSATTSSSLWAAPASETSSLWAARISTNPRIHPQHCSHPQNDNRTTSIPAPTITWSPQAPTPSHPEILAHKYNETQPLNLIITLPLSPIPMISTNPNP